MEYELLMVSTAREAEERAPHFRECLGQHLIASYVGRYGYKARVYFGSVQECREALRKEVELHRVRMVGFYIGADTLVPVANLIRWLKKTYPVTAFVGGPEAYGAGEGFLRDSLCDYIIPGEGEKPVLGLLRHVVDGAGTLRQIRSLKYIDGTGRYFENALEEPIEDLDDMPFPKRENSLNRSFRMSPSIGILTGRGCPYHCSFCFEGAASKKVRLRSMQNVFAEIEMVLGENKNLRCVNVYDDTFTLQRERVEAFCAYMKEKGLSWTCEGHVARICREPELLGKMVESGMAAMQIGIESGSRRVLEAYHKNTTPEMIEEAVRICKQAGLPTLEGNYIVGGAFETQETMRESIEHAKRLLEIGRGMLELSTVFLAPYCGTPVTERPEAFGLRIEEGLNGRVVLTMRDAVVSTAEMTAEQIVEAKRKFDEEIAEKYHTEAVKCRKQELIRGAGCLGRQMRVNQNWCTAWGRYPHLRNFLRHLTAQEQTAGADRYPVRTVGGYIFQDGRLSADGIALAGLEAMCVLWADGRRTLRRIAEQEGIALDRTLALYAELNERGYLYFSEF